MKWTLRENAGGLLSGYPRRGLRRAGASRDSRGDLERPAALSAVIGPRWSHAGSSSYSAQWLSRSLGRALVAGRLDHREGEPRRLAGACMPDAEGE
jgi:hypothetical protein